MGDFQYRLLYVYQRVSSDFTKMDGFWYHRAWFTRPWNIDGCELKIIM